MPITYPPEMLPKADGEPAEVIVVDPATGVRTKIVELPDGPCLECDGSGWLDDDCTDMCCECDGTGVAGNS